MIRKLGRALIVLAAVAAAAPGARAGVVLGIEIEDGHSYTRSNGFTGFHVEYEGDIALSADHARVDRLSKDGYLLIERRNFLRTRSLEVSPDASGAPIYRLTVGGRERSRSEALDFLSRYLPEAARVAPISAAADARRLLAASGPDAVLARLSRLESSEAQGIYLDVLLSSDSLSVPTLRHAAEEAGRVIGSSSRLRAALVRIAGFDPDDPDLTRDVVRATAHIGSSSEHAEAIVGVAHARGVTRATAPEYAASLEDIASSSEKERAIDRLSRLLREPEAAAALAPAAESIASSSEKRLALEALFEVPGLGPAEQVRLLKAGSGIASSSEKASYLAEAAGRMGPGDEVMRAYLDSAGSIPSSSEMARALRAAVRDRKITEKSAAALLETASGIASSSEKASLVADLVPRLDLTEAVLRSYFSCVGTIASSNGQREALVALLERGNLPASDVAKVMHFAQEQIASTSEREAVVNRAADRLARRTP
jgi:hypothetical protein